MSSQASRRRPYNVGEAAKAVGVSRMSMSRAIERGEVPAVRLGRRILVPTSVVSDLQNGRQPARPDAAPGGGS